MIADRKLCPECASHLSKDGLFCPSCGCFVFNGDQSRYLHGLHQRVTTIHDSNSDVALLLREREDGPGLEVMLGEDESFVWLSEGEEQRLCDALKYREAIRKGWTL